MGCRTIVTAFPTIAIGAGETIVMLGDSNTKGFQSGVGDNPAFRWWLDWEDAVTAAFNAASQTPPTFVNSGVTGANAQFLQQAPNFANLVTNHDPDHVVLMVGTNDVTQNVQEAAFRGFVASILSQSWSFNANMKFHLVDSVFRNGENWPNGTQGASDVSMDALNFQMASLAYANPGRCEYWQLRSQCWAWEAANNPGHAASGLLTQDGTHPSNTPAMGQSDSGQSLFSSLAYTQTTLTVPK